jgi:hypothetical protein
MRHRRKIAVCVFAHKPCKVPVLWPKELSQVPELTQDPFNILMGVSVYKQIAMIFRVFVISPNLELIQLILSDHCPKLIIVIRIHILIVA